jgi:Spy/CpxP family protein refolding chaperone
MMGEGYGPGMRGEGYGYGPGMMGGGYGMGLGMMGGLGALPSGLSAEQRTRIGEVQQDLRRKQWALMQQMHEIAWSRGDASPSAAPLDEQAARKQYDAVAAVRKQMFENTLDARKRIDAVLTPQQRQEWQGGWAGRGRGPR